MEEDMLCLSRKQIDEIVEHSKRESPNEACGILAGRGGRVERVYKMTNTDKSVTTFFMEPKEQLRVMKEIRKLNLKMLGIYHSHPGTIAYPSAHDVELAFYPEASYVIISLKDRDNPVIRAFKIANGNIKEEEIKIE
jgi:proteasome lid subunit RPN8/RPN11